MSKIPTNQNINKSKLNTENKTNTTVPKYYKSNKTMDVIDVAFEFDLGFAEGNVFKYIVRYKEKNGVEDLEKAKEYIDRMIKRHK